MNYCKTMQNIARHWNGSLAILKYKAFAYITLIFFLVLSANADSSIDSRQELKNSASPYLAMHASDKVKWQAWSEQLFLKAKKQNKPVYVSIGYYSCYWCHVLQKESFAHEETADYINNNFIPVVVDRELHPVLDARLSHFAEQTIGRSGWPLNVILTPDGYPFMATIYQPQKQFLSWFKKVQGLWQTDPQYIRDISKDAAQELSFGFKPEKSELSKEGGQAILKAFVAEVLSAADEFEGGFGDQAKFPLPAILDVVLDVYAKTKNDQLLEFLNLTLEKMASQGLNDLLLAGFFRYTTDPGWQIPHFEKMLYDNAQLASLYLKAGVLLKNPDFIDVGKQTLDFMLQHLRSEHGAFYGSFSAVDEHGVEGGNYLWPKVVWQKHLNTKQQKLVKFAWGWGENGILAEGYLPVVASELAELSFIMKMTSAEISVELAQIKSILLNIRRQRELPRDEKVILSWNALTLQALLTGYKITGLEKYRKSADTLAIFLQKHMQGGGRLYRSWHNGVLAGEVSLEDYVYLAQAFYDYYLVNKNPQLLSLIHSYMTQAWNNYFSAQGWQLSDSFIIPYGDAEALLSDGPLPSASAMLVGLSLQLEMKLFHQKAIIAMQYGHGIQRTRPFWFASHVRLLAFFIED